MSNGVEVELLEIERKELGGGRIIKKVMTDVAQTKDGAA
jgi:hypothetical protein